MDARPVLHPSAGDLAAFVQGKLDDPSAEKVVRHLDECADCRNAAAAQSGDDFLDRLRAAHGLSGTPMPDRSLAALQPESASGAASSSQPAVPNLPPELARLPQYEVLKELGRGGMGVVYLARHRLSGRREVLKVMNREVLSRPGSKDRFLREIQAAALLKHDYVVQMYTAAEVGDLMLLVMEYVEGKDLGGVVRGSGPLPVALACRYVHQVALALQHAHERGMVHRDIKPENLILTREGGKPVVKVLDFGLAKVRSEKGADADLTGEGRMLGTPHYMAPEQILDAAHADIRADVYSLGCTLYCLLTGAPPFHEGQNLYAILQAHHSTDARPVNLVRPEVPAGLAAVVAKMMAKDAAQRYQRPVEVAQALGPFTKEGATPKSIPGSSPNTAEVRRAVQKAERSQPSQAPAVEERQRQPAALGRSLAERGSASSGPRKSGAVRKQRPQAARPATMTKWLLGGGVAAGALLTLVLLALVGLWATGAFKVKTKDGTIVLDNLPADAEVMVDGNMVKVTWADGGKRAVIRVKPGTHKLVATSGALQVIGEEVEIAHNGRKVVTARLRPPEEGPARGPPGNKPEGFVPLFNGKDKAGWKTQPEWEGGWRVENGALIWARHSRGFLWTERDDYTDFHLHVETRIGDGAYAHVGVRDTFSEPGKPCGYGIVINSNNENDKKTGSLVADFRGPVVRVLKPLVPPNQWFILDVIVRGHHVVVKVNGQTTADFTDPERRNSRGRFTLRAVNDRIEFRKIEIKELK